MNRTRANLSLAAAWLVGAAAFFVGEAIAAASVPASYGYSYVSDYISQLGVPGWTPLALVMNSGLCLQAVLFLTGAVLAARAGSGTGRPRLFIVLASAYALGLVFVATVPSGTGAPANDYAALHWLGALLAIFVGNSAALVGSNVLAGLVGARWYRRTSVLIAVLGFVSFLIMSQPAARSTLGIWERGSVYSLMVWQVFTAVVLLTRAGAGQPTRR